MASKPLPTQNDPPDSLEEATVLEGCRVGDRSAQHRLYEAHYPLVYGLMVRIAGMQDAADLTQQVFLQVFRKLDQFVGESTFETWLYRLAVNEALQYLRKDRRWKFQTLTHEPMSREPENEDREVQKELLDRALAQLDPDLRAIFLLREVEHLSYRDIAAALEIPEGTVGSRLNRARRELQNHLTDLGWLA